MAFDFDFEDDPAKFGPEDEHADDFFGMMDCIAAIGNPDHECIHCY